MSIVAVSDLAGEHLGKVATVNHYDGTTVTGRICRIDHIDPRVPMEKNRVAIELAVVGHRLGLSCDAFTHIQIED